ncbi:hypothetical protein LIER_19034 [Lithospermum erythrorhizon]|uniref:Uncharacterized protein n=1 Tax=Lithospermum erythrorhizon TaxID=34254 RepID=A0AAV3QLM8_LITER
MLWHIRDIENGQRSLWVLPWKFWCLKHIAFSSPVIAREKESEDSESEDHDSKKRPRCSIQTQLDTLHRDHAALRATVQRNYEERMSCYTGIIRFLTCWEKKKGATNEDLAHLHIPEHRQMEQIRLEIC